MRVRVLRHPLQIDLGELATPVRVLHGQLGKNRVKHGDFVAPLLVEDDQPQDLAVGSFRAPDFGIERDLVQDG